VTLGEVLAGAVDPSAITGKIVLIGVTAESVKDHFYTPYSRRLAANQQFSGAAIHFHVVSQLLRTALGEARPMAIVPPWAGALWALLWSAAGTLVGFLVRAPWRFVLALLAGLAGLALVSFGMFVLAWWPPLVATAAAWLASAALATAYMSYREVQQRSALMRLFSSSVSPEVAQSIWRRREEFLSGGRPRSESLVVTALFTDLAGFTSLSEELGPQAMMEWLNEYMAAMAGHVSRHGGVIRQYAGDSIVAIFGVPFARRSEPEIARDAVNAVACALAMRATLRELNRRWAAQQRPVTGMRIGLFTGPAVAGALGSAERSEYVVVGDTMNIASRLESFDKQLFAPDPASDPCRILAGETTCSYLGGRFATERIGDVRLRGKQQAVAVYRVLSEGGAT
jgi:adenylate cyclase